MLLREFSPSILSVKQWEGMYQILVMWKHIMSKLFMFCTDAGFELEQFANQVNGNGKVNSRAYCQIEFNFSFQTTRFIMKYLFRFS